MRLRILSLFLVVLAIGCGEPPVEVSSSKDVKPIDPQLAAKEGQRAIADQRERIRTAPNLTPEQKEQALRMLGER